VEIQNTQSGQAFASVTQSSQAEVVRADKAVSPESNSGNGQSFSQEQGTANPSAERLGSNTVSVNQNLSQASRQQADTEVSESSGAQLEEAVAKVESFLKVQNRDLAFTIDEDTKRSVVTVKDSSSGDVIRQIPSEEVLKLAERIQELQQDVGNSVGVFINNQV